MHFVRLARRQEGQAVIEYVLVLIVTVSLLMAFKSSFKSLDEFIYKFMGEYIACLMEYGELPSKGVADTNIDQHNPANGGGGKGCDSKFARFSLTAGRPPTSSTSKASSNSTATSQSANADRNSLQNASQASKKTSNDSLSANGTNSENSSVGQQANSNSSPYANGRIKRSSGSDSNGIADGSNTAEDGKVKVINQEESDAARRARLGQDAGQSTRRMVYDRNRYRAITGKQLEVLEKQTKVLRVPSATVIAVDEEGRIGPRRSTITPPEIKAATAEKQDDNEMNFGYFLKWLIIAAMGIAIFLFFGSQVMSFMNSQEK